MVSNSELLASSRLPAVLYVDDEPLSQKYFRSSISPYAEVITASNPIEARRILAVRANSISVVVSDERMPIEAGVPFLADVRRTWPTARRVLTSAYADVDNLQQAINDAAIFHFVPKPWDVDLLCQVVRDALRSEADAADAEPELAGQSPNDRLAEFAARLGQPLEELEVETMRLLSLTGTSTVQPPSASHAHISNWSMQRKLGQISSAANRVQMATAACRSLAAQMLEFVAKRRRLQ